LASGSISSLRRHAAEDRRLLRQVSDAQPRAPVHRKPRDVGTVDLDRAGVGRDQAGDHVEAGRLARAVRPQQAHDLAALQRQADVAHHGAAVIGLGNARDDESLAALDHAGAVGNIGLDVGRVSHWQEPCLFVFKET